MTIFKNIVDFILGWTRDVAELRSIYKTNKQDYQ